jgi:pyoverdine/dityrosine biosynthesis protein Dit1
MKALTVTDGHVFNDCIGVDYDYAVDLYTKQLNDLFKKAFKTEGAESEGFIGFVSLKGLFFTKDHNMIPKLIETVDLLDRTRTKINDDSELRPDGRM